MAAKIDDLKITAPYISGLKSNMVRKEEEGIKEKVFLKYPAICPLLTYRVAIQLVFGINFSLFVWWEICKRICLLTPKYEMVGPIGFA